MLENKFYLYFKKKKSTLPSEKLFFLKTQYYEVGMNERASASGKTDEDPEGFPVAIVRQVMATHDRLPPAATERKTADSGTNAVDG